MLITQEDKSSQETKDHIPLVVKFHPVPNEIRDILRRLHTMLGASEEHMIRRTAVFRAEHEIWLYSMPGSEEGITPKHKHCVR